MKIRLYLPAEYAEGMMLTLDKPQSHYLANVMRVKAGQEIAVFNGRDGEWLAEVTQADKKYVSIALKNQRLAHISSPDVWLAFAPIKNKTGIVVEKATELGCSKLLPVYMQHSVVTDINMEKLNLNAIEAAEQSERHDVPEIEEHKTLGALLSTWPKDRALFFADESGGGAPFTEVLREATHKKIAVLIGPEGGFSNDERHMLKQLPQTIPFGMGPRILRADTAAIAALACVQAWVGDWQRAPHFINESTS